MLKGFRDFLMRGNVIDLAVAVIIGNAFTAIVKSVTDEPVQPADRGDRRRNVNGLASLVGNNRRP